MKHLPHLIFSAIFILFIFFIFAAYRDYGISWDETSFWYHGKVFAENFLDTDKIVALSDPKHIIHHGSILEPLYYLLANDGTNVPNFDRIHLVKALLASQTLIAVYLTLRLLCRNRWSPIMGVLFLIFYPRWLGDIFDNYIDIISTYLYAWMIFLSLLTLKQKGQKKLLLSLTILVGISTIAFIHRPILIFANLLFVPFVARKIKEFRNRRNIALSALFLTLMVIGIKFITSPFIRIHGLGGIIQKIVLIARLKNILPQETFFEGKIVSTDHLPWYYLPKWIYISSPVITLFFAGMAVLALLLAISRKKADSGRIFITSAFFVPLIFTMIARPVLYDTWRVFLFLIIPIVLLASLRIDDLFSKKRKVVSLLVAFFIALNVGISAKEMWSLHPYEYLYFNTFSGFLKNASTQYETDYWGKSYKEATHWLTSNRIRNPKKIYAIFVCDNPDLAYPFFKENMIVVNNLKLADYALCYTRDGADKTITFGTIIHTVEREGTILNYVKQMR